MKVSYVIVTRNRRDSLLSTLRKLEDNTPLPADQWEVWIVDNASDDGSPEAVAAAYPCARILRRPSNEGMPARNHAFGVARGQYIVLLDDDSYPIGDAMRDALGYLDTHPRTAALVARVVLPSGQCEGPAMPAILLGGASVIRKSVLDEVGGFAWEFFRQAEEYDLSFRIWDAGYAIERFEDIFFRHEKVPGGRSSELVRRMDLRNNLILVERYLPRELRKQYRRDWLRRYAAFAIHDGLKQAVSDAVREARQWGRREASQGRRILRPQTIETLFQLDAQARQIAQWTRRQRIGRVVIADLSKSLYATWRACRLAGLEVVAIADDNPAYAGILYRGAPVLPVAEAAGLEPDGIVLSNINPAQIDARLAQLKAAFTGPVLRLWEPRYLWGVAQPEAAACRASA